MSDREGDTGNESMLNQPTIQNVVLRVPEPLLERLDEFTQERGTSRHSAILYLLDLGMGADAEIMRRVDAVKAKLRVKIERDLAETSTA